MMTAYKFTFPIRIYYEDTDAGGVVYHARYLHFFERARTEFLRALGFSQQELFKLNLAFVVRKIDVEFHLPAKLDDLLEIETQVLFLKGASIVFAQNLKRNSIILCGATVKVACVNLEKVKPVAIPVAIRNGFLSLK